MSNTNTSGANYSTNVITVSQWTTLEQHGAVFLPAAGRRKGTSVSSVGSFGLYWSASYHGFGIAFGVLFSDGRLNASDADVHHYGQSVRLVCPVENYSIHATPSPAEGGAVSGAGAYMAGAECTLTATASAGYTFAYWTENGEVVSTDAEYTFTVTGDRTLVANFTQNGSMGKLNGQFTVGENAVVCFSQGNLQYKASTNTWRFAENQYDYVGSDNSNISQTYSGLIDLFGWGMSGYNHGANCYQPWSTSTSSSDYYAYGNSSYNLFDQTGKADWGYNAISNGGNTENSGWRTLTREEWDYLFNTRSTSSGIRYAKATVNSVNGVILLPDDWSSDYYTLNSTNTSGVGFSSNIITASQWAILEQHGAVFLPAAGIRYGTSVSNVGSDGYYWSASYGNSSYAYLVYFGDGYLNASSYGYYRYYGPSVRLVRTVGNYSIHASPSPAEGGAVSGAGAYQAGAACTLTATASAGYTFAYWTENGEVVSTDAEYTFTVTGDRTLVANFTQNGSMGKLNGQFTVGENAVVCFSQGNLQYKASTNTWRFAENQYDYVGSDNSNSGLIDLFGWGTSGYNHGANCYQPWSTSPSDSYYYAYGNSSYNLFDQTGQADWGYNAISNGGNQEHSGWRTLTREEWDYLFNTRVTSSGIRYAKARVNNVSGVILLPDDWQTSYYSLNSTNTSGASFSTNVITVTQWNTLQQHGVVFLPAAGGRNGASIYGVGSNGNYWSASYIDSYYAYGVYFDYGSLDASGNYNRYFGLSVRLVRTVGNYSIQATPSPLEGGAVSGAGTYLEGAECTLTATASAGYHFFNWTENGEVVSTDAVYTFMVTGERTLVANFEQLDNHWTPVSGMSGSMTILGILKIDGVEPHAYYLEVGAFCGSECRGSALPEFIDNYCVYALNIAGDTEGQPITFKVYDHHLGQELDLYGTNELVFADGMYYGMEEFYEFNFLNYYQVTTSVEPANAGTVTGAYIYTYGSSCTLTATPATGYHFVNWTQNGNTVSTSPEYTFVVTGAGDYVAYFALNSYTITATADPAAGGSVTGTGTYTHGATVTLTATASTGYTFDHWTKDGTEVSINVTYSFTATQTGSYTAHFTLNSYAVTATANPAEGGSVEGAGNYGYGQTCTLTATANEGWQFNSWTVDGETVSTETTYSFTVEGPANVTALFDLAQTVELKQGWTWWSTGVELTGIDGLSILEEGLNPYGRVIKNNEKFVQYQVALNRWIGGLNVLTNEEGYKVNASQTCPVTIVGPAANPEDHPITIHSNWTWIGYPASHQQSVGAALAGFNPEVNDIIKSQSSSARYLPNTGWIPATFTLNPGESYMYYSKAADDKTLVYANGRSAVTSETDDRHWRNDVHAFADNLCLLAVVELDGVEQRSEALELGAFFNGECRGSAKLMYVEPLDRYYAMLTVMGEDGDEIEFALTDHNNIKTKYQSENHLTFATDAIVGEFDDPFVVRFGGLSSVEEQDLTLGLYPNPVGRNEAVRLLVPEDETVTEWTVVNALGAVVRHEAATGMPQETRIEGLPVSGVYLVKVSCQSGKVYWNRLIVK